MPRAFFIFVHNGYKTMSIIIIGLVWVYLQSPNICGGGGGGEDRGGIIMHEPPWQTEEMGVGVGGPLM